MFGKKDDKPKRTAFEYKVKFFHKPDHRQEANSNFNTKLNDIGADGWEIVTANERPLHNRRFTPLLGFGMFALVNLRRFYGPIFA
jgi:hypothetical protein